MNDTEPLYKEEAGVKHFSSFASLNKWLEARDAEKKRERERERLKVKRIMSSGNKRI